MRRTDLSEVNSIAKIVGMKVRKNLDERKRRGSIVPTHKISKEQLQIQQELLVLLGDCCRVIQKLQGMPKFFFAFFVFIACSASPLT